MESLYFFISRVDLCRRYVCFYCVRVRGRRVRVSLPPVITVYRICTQLFLTSPQCVENMGLDACKGRENIEEDQLFISPNDNVQ